MVKLGRDLKQHPSCDSIESAAKACITSPPSEWWDLRRLIGTVCLPRNVLRLIICFYVSTMEAFLRRSSPRLLEEIGSWDQNHVSQGEVAQ